MSFYDSEYTTIKLTEKSSILTGKLPEELKMSEEEFNELWKMRPTEEQYVKIYGKMVKIPRKNRAYGNTYSFAGITEKKNETTPNIIQRYMDYCLCNGALVNWYENGEDYIGPHSDDEKSLIKNSDIFTISFGAERTFRVSPIKDKQMNITQNKGSGSPSGNSIDFKTKENEIIAMSGSFQKEFKHSIPKTKKCKEKRISITLRKFK